MKINFRPLRRFGSTALVALMGLGLSASACTDTGTSTDDVTDIDNSKVKDQSIGNCWLYATVGWAESLHKTHTGTELDMSESWLTFFHWFDQISDPSDQGQMSRMSGGELTTGGWWGLAAEIIRRYGVIDEGAFIPTEADAPESSRQSTALNKMKASLKDGALSTAEARRDRKLVLTELMEAWELDENVRKMIIDTFGEEGQFTLVDDAAVATDSPIHRPEAIAVGKALKNGQYIQLSLGDAIGTPRSSWNVIERSGEFAWGEENYPRNASSRRNFQVKIQQTLHNRLPAIMTWFVDFNMLKDSEFKKRDLDPGRQGGHMTVLEDYQVNKVPGHGTLAAGELVTDPAILEAALAPEAEIEFFVAKNSWGGGIAPPNTESGYHNLHMSYLDGPLTKCTEANGDKCGRKTEGPGLLGIVFPPANFEIGLGSTDDPNACHDICETGAALSSACSDTCVDQIIAEDPFCTESTWDDLCVEAVVTVCEQACPASE